MCSRRQVHDMVIGKIETNNRLSSEKYHAGIAQLMQNDCANDPVFVIHGVLEDSEAPN
jgi:hypothetical protein